LLKILNFDLKLYPLNIYKFIKIKLNLNIFLKNYFKFIVKKLNLNTLIKGKILSMERIDILT